MKSSATALFHPVVETANKKRGKKRRGILMLRIRPIPAQRVKVSIEVFGVREPCDTAGEILPVPPLIKKGTQKPPFVKGAARSAGGFGNVAVMKRTFTSSIAVLPPSTGEAMLRPR